MNQLLAAVTELHSRLPSFPCRVLAYRESVPSGLCGVYVSLCGAHTEQVIGLLAPGTTWDALTRALDRDRPRREPRGVVEGACEVSRTLAESFRHTLPDSQCVIGLPLFAEGMVSGGRRLQLQVCDVVLAGKPVLLVLFRRSLEAKPASERTGPSPQGDAA
ncbi:MAG TPA: hypothetical protein VHB79_14565 [Polyangiaceae bacterium]|nr:hypothetical protein [Polyangiaceae bacterium]